jgi:hypothetical protein
MSTSTLSAVFAKRNAKLAKVAKTDKSLRAYARSGHPLTGRVALMDGRVYREVKHAVHGLYWTVKPIRGLDKSIQTAHRAPVSAAPSAAVSPAASVAVEALTLKLSLLREMMAMVKAIA